MMKPGLRVLGSFVWHGGQRGEMFRFVSFPPFAFGTMWCG